jgi:sulfur carrier protein
MIKIIVNGQEMEFEEALSLKKLIQKLKIEEKVMAAAVNMNVVKKEEWENFKLKNKDKVELLHFVGGG